jgi:hypothetical protein
MHHECIDFAKRNMPEHPWQRSNGVKPMLLPKRNRGIVGGDNEVELHRGEAKAACLLQRVLAHHRANPATASAGRHHVTRISYMRPESRMIRFKDVCAIYAIVLRGDERMGLRRKPIS